MEGFMNLRVILVQGHANLLCVVSILVYVLPKQAPVPTFLYKKFLLCVWVFCQHVCLCKSGTSRSQKRMLDRLELKLQMGVSQLLGGGNWTQILWKNNQYF